MGKYNKGASTNLIHIISDTVLSAIGFGLSVLIAIIHNYQRYGTYMLNNEQTFIDKSSSEVLFSYFIIAFTFTFIYILASKEARLYNVTTFFYLDRVLKLVTKSFLMALSIEGILLLYIGKVELDEVFIISYIAIMYFLMFMSALISRGIVKKSDRFAPRTLLIGSPEEYEKFLAYMGKGNSDIKLIGYVAYEDCINGTDYIGSVYDLEELIHNNAVDQVYAMSKLGRERDVQQYMDKCIEMGITFRVVINDYSVSTSAQSYVSSIGTYPVVTWHTVSLNMGSRMTKRTIDIIGSLVGIILSSPVMLIAIIAIKIDSKGPAIFKQTRVGKNGRQFGMLKFRSMCQDAEAKKAELEKQNEVKGGFMFKIHNDPRITRVGRIIRKTNIDELPQFFNVLAGHMSLVGTRPPTLDEIEKYEPNHWRRISIKPGLTGMWQVSGRSNITDFDEIVRLDIEYIDKWNVLKDFKIMGMTVLQVFKRNKSAC